MKGIKKKRKYEKVEKFDLRAAPERLLQVFFSLFFTVALRALFLLLLCRSSGASFFFFSLKMVRKSEQNPTLDVMRRPYLVSPPSARLDLHQSCIKGSGAWTEVVLSVGNIRSRRDTLAVERSAVISKSWFQDSLLAILLFVPPRS
jgi:hypothetical protein